MKVPLQCAWIAFLLAWSATSTPADVTLFGTDAAPGQRNLLRIDPVTGAGTVIGPTGAEIAGLTYDIPHDILYGSSTTALYSINQSTGAAQLIGPFGFELIHTIEYDPLNQVLYGMKSERAPFGLCTINVSTGQATLIAPVTASSLIGMALDPATDTLYASDIQADRLVTVNKQTGALSPVGNFNAGVQVGVGLPARNRS